MATHATDRLSYVPPRVEDKGTLVDLTREMDVSLLGVATKFISLAAASGPTGSTIPLVTDQNSVLPQSSTGGSTSPSTVTPGSGTSPMDASGTSPTNSSGTSPVSGVSPVGNSGGRGSGGVAASTGGSLPFTGLALMLVAGAGVSMSGAGEAMRKRLKRFHSQ